MPFAITLTEKQMTSIMEIAAKMMAAGIWPNVVTKTRPGDAVFPKEIAPVKVKDKRVRDLRKLLVEGDEVVVGTVAAQYLDPQDQHLALHEVPHDRATKLPKESAQ